MPTGVQQTIEGLLCGVCEGILGDPSSLHDELCLRCEDQYIVYCEGCCEEMVDASVADWATRNAYIRLGFGTSAFYSTDDTGNYLCVDCIYHCPNCSASYEYQDEQQNCCFVDDDLVHNYSYRPTFTYSKMNGDVVQTAWQATPGLLYMGAEIEVNKMSGLVERFIDACNMKQQEFLYFKEDGSLGPEGVELVTMPATLDAFKQVFPFDAMDDARRWGARSFGYSNCGFHIHVARSAFTPSHMWKFVRFQLNNPILCQRVAQRDESSYASWYFEESEKRSLPEYVKGTKTNGRRYLAINFQNHATVELRYFKGNILRGAIMKNMEFVQSIYDYTKDLTVREVMGGALKEMNYMLFIGDNAEKYPNLIHFLDNNSNEGGN